MNVLLVDDEDYVLDYIEENMDWPSLGVTHLYRASSVDEALEVLHHIPISITITDIRMPEKSGLELLAAIHRTKPHIKVILLSGYSEFEYAKQALQHGAADYLLKPVTHDEVEACLHKVIALIDHENKNKKDLLAAQDMLRYGLSRMREHLLLDLLLGKRYSRSELEHHFTSLRLPLAPEDACMLTLLRIETNLADSSLEDLELFRYAIVNMAEEIFECQEVPQPTLWNCRDSHSYLVMVLPIRYLGGIDLVTERIRQLQHLVHSYLKRTISVLVSRPFLLHEGLGSAYLQALHRFWLTIGTKNDVMVTLEEQANATEMKPLLRLYEPPALMQLMDSGRWEEAMNRVEAILDELNLPDYQTQEHAAEVVYHLYSCFSYLAHKQGEAITDLLGGSSSKPPLYYHSIDSIRTWAVSLMDQFRVSLHDNSGNQSRVIRQIQVYIEQNLQNDLSLNLIGEHVYLHPVYLSRLYKKETGESLSTYITRVKMERAAHLLTTTNKRVSDIAVEVGYQKAQYFIRLFKEFHGCTPQSFRNQ